MATDLRDPANRVSPRARTLWHLEAGLVGASATVAAIVVVALWLDHPWGWTLVGMVAVLGAATTYGVPLWRYRVHRWEASETAVYTQRGWWRRERRIAPMSRVQTVDLAQGPLALLFRLATVTVTTASAAGALRIEGLDRDVALRLVDDLTRKADRSEGDAT